MSIAVSVINHVKSSNGKAASKNINFINPAASDNDVATFMASLNGLSTDTLEKIERVSKRELSIPQPATSD